MSDSVEIWEKPEATEIFMLAGWRQWADAGTVSSGLPQYLIQESGARQIGSLRPDGFYLFQIPGTHDLLRPVVKFNEGYPEKLHTLRNDFYYTSYGPRGLVIFVGDEPHLDVERYVAGILDTAQMLGVERIVGFGGVYGELPYDKERAISASYSLPQLKEEISQLAVNLSDYHGGASIGSYLARRAGDREMEFVGLYAFVPTYDFSSFAPVENSIRIETDYMAWLAVMRRVNYMLKMDFDLKDLERKSERLIEVMNAKIEELDSAIPQASVREYLQRLSDEFTEMPFDPLSDIWKDELRRLFDKLDEDET